MSSRLMQINFCLRPNLIPPKQGAGHGPGEARRHGAGAMPGRGVLASVLDVQRAL
jgi:hypothetical protein